jgi:hypothetical protein
VENCCFSVVLLFKKLCEKGCFVVRLTHILLHNELLEISTVGG